MRTVDRAQQHLLDCLYNIVDARKSPWALGEGVRLVWVNTPNWTTPSDGGVCLIHDGSTSGGPTMFIAVFNKGNPWQLQEDTIRINDAGQAKDFLISAIQQTIYERVEEYCAKRKG